MKGLDEINRENARRKQIQAAGVTVPVQVTQQMLDALEELRDTGFYGNGHDVPSVAEELLRAALRQIRSAR